MISDRLRRKLITLIQLDLIDTSWKVVLSQSMWLMQGISSLLMTLQTHRCVFQLRINLQTLKESTTLTIQSGMKLLHLISQKVQNLLSLKWWTLFQQDRRRLLVDMRLIFLNYTYRKSRWLETKMIMPMWRRRQLIS